MRIKNLSIIFILVLALAACQSKQSKIEDFNKILYAPEYASGFDIKGAEGKESTLIAVNNPWQGADSVRTQLFIVRNGESAPEGFTGQVIKGDAKRIVTMSSTHIAMLDAMDAAGNVVGVSGIDYISNEMCSRTVTAWAMWVSRAISTMNCCCHSTPTSFYSTE